MKTLERHYAEITKAMGPLSTQIQAVDISSAAHWFFAESSKEDWDHREDFPTVVSPFPVAWMEYEYPPIINSEGTFLRTHFGGFRVGAMFVTAEVKEESRIAFVRENVMGRYIAGQAQKMGFTLAPKNDPPDRARILEEQIAQFGGARWYSIARFYMESRDHRLLPMHITALFYLDAMGKPLLATQYFGQVTPGSGSTVLPFFFGISLMHAKNVSVEEIRIPPKVAARRAKAGIPDVKFKTLQVHSLRKITSSGKDSGDAGIARALHFVRGHFKDFREGAGLFGKHRDIYWWDLHTRGEEASGRIIKDYQVIKDDAA